MTSARVRLIVAAGLFLAWIGWLAYLAATVTRPIVLSRPQFLAANLDVIADLSEADDGPSPKIKVVEVLWPKGLKGKVKETITVANLAEVSREQGWQGPGRYLLPLKRTTDAGKVEYQVPAIPHSPGYPPAKVGPDGAVRIYLDTPETRSQEERIRNGEWE
jgi:hypothetical protein